jgi:hypothetical protein
VHQVRAVDTIDLGHVCFQVRGVEAVSATPDDEFEDAAIGAVLDIEIEVPRTERVVLDAVQYDDRLRVWPGGTVPPSTVMSWFTAAINTTTRP